MGDVHLLMKSIVSVTVGVLSGMTGRSRRAAIVIDGLKLRIKHLSSNLTANNRKREGKKRQRVMVQVVTRQVRTWSHLAFFSITPLVSTTTPLQPPSESLSIMHVDAMRMLYIAESNCDELLPPRERSKRSKLPRLPAISLPLTVEFWEIT